MLKMAQKEYIKHLYEVEDKSVLEIANTKINTTTAVSEIRTVLPLLFAVFPTDFIV